MKSMTHPLARERGVPIGGMLADISVGDYVRHKQRPAIAEQLIPVEGSHQVAKAYQSSGNEGLPIGEQVEEKETLPKETKTPTRSDEETQNNNGLTGRNTVIVRQKQTTAAKVFSSATDKWKIRFQDWSSQIVDATELTLFMRNPVRPVPNVLKQRGLRGVTGQLVDAIAIRIQENDTKQYPESTSSSSEGDQVGENVESPSRGQSKRDSEGGRKTSNRLNGATKHYTDSDEEEGEKTGKTRCSKASFFTALQFAPEEGDEMEIESGKEEKKVEDKIEIEMKDMKDFGKEDMKKPLLGDDVEMMDDSTRVDSKSSLLPKTDSKCAKSCFSRTTTKESATKSSSKESSIPLTAENLRHHFGGKVKGSSSKKREKWKDHMDAHPMNGLINHSEQHRHRPRLRKVLRPQRGPIPYLYPTRFICACEEAKMFFRDPEGAIGGWIESGMRARESQTRWKHFCWLQHCKTSNPNHISKTQTVKEWNEAFVAAGFRKLKHRSYRRRAHYPDPNLVIEVLKQLIDEDAEVQKQRQDMRSTFQKLGRIEERVEDKETALFHPSSVPIKPALNSSNNSSKSTTSSSSTTASSGSAWKDSASSGSTTSKCDESGTSNQTRSSISSGPTIIPRGSFIKPELIYGALERLPEALVTTRTKQVMKDAIQKGYEVETYDEEFLSGGVFEILQQTLDEDAWNEQNTVAGKRNAPKTPHPDTRKWITRASRQELKRNALDRHNDENASTSDTSSESECNSDDDEKKYTLNTLFDHFLVPDIRMKKKKHVASEAAKRRWYQSTNANAAASSNRNSMICTNPCDDLGPPRVPSIPFVCGFCGRYGQDLMECECGENYCNPSCRLADLRNHRSKCEGKMNSNPAVVTAMRCWYRWNVSARDAEGREIDVNKGSGAGHQEK